MRAFILDDEPLAVTRLRRMLEETMRIDVVGCSSAPAEALDRVRELRPDVLFLDIQMPELSGFDFLERLDPPQPLVVFTTAYDEYALHAFKVNSIDYLLKPVDAADLRRALSKLERLLDGPRQDLTSLLSQMRTLVEDRRPDYLARVASRVGDRVELVDIAAVTHFYARDKLTFAVTETKHHAIDLSIAELEKRLPPGRWIRIHRATLLNVDAVKELRAWFGGRLLLRLKDGRTELQVARDRAAEVRAKLGL
jgi:two-component system LytT family response regulator